MFFDTDLIGEETVNATWNIVVEEDLSSYTVLSKLPSSMFNQIGNYVRITIQAPSAGGTLNNVTISNVADTGNAYDADTTPTEITWETSASLTMGEGEQYTSDWIAFPFNISSKLIGFNLGSTTSIVKGYLEDATMYFLTSVQEADNTTRTASYSYYKNTIPYILSIEVAP